MAALFDLHSICIQVTEIKPQILIASGGLDNEHVEWILRRRSQATNNAYFKKKLFEAHFKSHHPALLSHMH